MVDIRWTPYLACAYAERFCEGENATLEEQLEAWAYIIKNRLYENLQGWYGRMVANIIHSGIISRDGEINHDRVDNILKHE